MPGPPPPVQFREKSDVYTVPATDKAQGANHQSTRVAYAQLEIPDEDPNFSPSGSNPPHVFTGMGYDLRSKARRVQ